jgi:Flp pilus assembly pilin Flp
MRNLTTDERGAEVIEAAFVMALILVAAVCVLSLCGVRTINRFFDVHDFF